MLNAIARLTIVPTPLERYRSERHCRRPRREFKEEAGADGGHGRPVGSYSVLSRLSGNETRWHARVEECRTSLSARAG